MGEKLIVTAAGAGLILWVNWYFFFSKRRSAKSSVQEGRIQEIKINVKGGYDPDVLFVKKGVPVRLSFYRDETADCSETVVFSDFGIRKDLPAYRTTAVEFTPEKEGEYIFTCGMGMLRGKLIVR